MDDEIALLRDVKRLDEKALVALFDKYAPALYNYAMRLCHDPVESDNAVGDVFTKLLEQLAVGEGPVTNLRAYLYRMVYHCIVDGTRHNHRFAPLEDVLDVPFRSKADSVTSQVEGRHMLEDFRSVLNGELTEIQRHVVILRFVEDFSLRETAVIVGKKINHVKVIQNRAIAKLRRSSRIQSWSSGTSSPA